MTLDAEIIVVGGGPSGTAIASEIALAGVSVIVLERRQHEVESRAGTLLPRVLELLDSRGICDRFIDRMNGILPFPFRPDHIHAGLKPVRWSHLESRFGFTLGLPQNHTEDILTAYARELGVDLRNGHSVTGLSQAVDHVAVETETPGGRAILRARYVVGADGGRSTVRHALGMPFEGHPGTFTGMVVDATIKAPWPTGNFGTDNAMGWLRGFAFAPDITRFNMVHRESMKQPKDAPVTIDEVRQALRDITGQDFGVTGFRWASRYDDTMRAVPRLRDGRVFLVGESARIHYPASGVGMNFCIQDAFNLGWKLALVSKGQAAESLLDSYQTERYPVLERLLASVRAQCAMQFNFSDDGVALKRRFESLHMPVPAVNRALALELNGLEEAYPSAEPPHPLVGRPMPDLDLVLPGGRLTRVGEMLRGLRFVLLDLTGQNGFAALDPGGLPAVAVTALASRRIGATAALHAALVRPDGYVAWATDTLTTPQAARAAISRALGRSDLPSNT
ncbi:MAG: FAD-dependent monooxygenase [Rhodobacteraceae bacterium]|nr:FAD-dependent monooxygenase [Paracoccaceae bacterium]